MRSINLGFLRTPENAAMAVTLAMATGCMVTTMQITGLTGAEIAAECKKFRLDLLVLGSQDPVPKMTAEAGVPVVVFQNGKALRAHFSGSRIEFEEYNIPQKAKVFCLRQRTGEFESELISGERSPEEVLARLKQEESAILVLPEVLPSIYDAQKDGVRCVAATPTGTIVEVIVHVHNQPFSIDIETRPFVA